jgi:hypothetical protein
MLLLSAPAWALRLELRPSAQLGVQYDTNVFRAEESTVLPDGNQRDDVFYRAAVGAKAQAFEGLQNVSAEVVYGRDEYQHYQQLSAPFYQLRLNAQLKLASLVAADTQILRERRLETFFFRTDTQPGFTNLLSAQQSFTLNVTPQLKPSVSLQTFRLRNTLNTSQDFDFDENTLALGLAYDQTDIAAVGVIARLTEGEFVNRIPQVGREQNYQQRSLNLTGRYNLSGISVATFDAGYTQRQPNDPSVPEFSGFAGDVGLQYQITPLTRAKLSVFSNLFSVQEVGASFAQALGANFLLNHQLTPNNALTLDLRQQQYDYKGGSLLATSGQRRDSIFNGRLGWEYQIRDGLRLVPQIRYENRRSNQPGLRFDYVVVDVNLFYDYAGGFGR